MSLSKKVLIATAIGAAASLAFAGACFAQEDTAAISNGISATSTATTTAAQIDKVAVYEQAISDFFDQKIGMTGKILDMEKEKITTLEAQGLDLSDASSTLATARENLSLAQDEKTELLGKLKKYEGNKATKKLADTLKKLVVIYERNLNAGEKRAEKIAAEIQSGIDASSASTNDNATATSTEATSSPAAE